MIPDINLIPKLDKEQNTSKWVYILVGAITLLVLSFLIWQYFSARISIAALQPEETALIQKRDQLNADLAELTSSQTDSIDETIEYIDLISYPVLPLINEIENLQPNFAYLRQYSFGTDSVSVVIDFETLSDVSDYVSRLENSDFFVEVQLSNVSQFDFGETTVEGTDVTEESFNVVPRHTANLTLMIDKIYLATGGVR